MNLGSECEGLEGESTAECEGSKGELTLECEGSDIGNDGLIGDGLDIGDEDGLIGNGFGFGLGSEPS